MSEYKPITENGRFKAAYIEPMNPHLSMSRISPKGQSGIFRCDACGREGPISEINAEPCAALQPAPCKACGLTPICARDCPGIRDALSSDDVYVIDGEG